MEKSLQITSISSRRSWIYLLCIGLSFSGISQAGAASESDPQTSLHLDVPTSVEVVTPKRFHTSGELKFEGTKYQSSIPGNSKLDHSVSAAAHLKAGYETDNSSSLLDFTGEKFVDWGSSQFSVSEFYWSRAAFDGHTQLSLGRKLEYWSQADEDWELDMWQPRQTFDGLRPEQQGLTGGFIKHRQGQIEVLALLSPIFIPTMGPDIKNDNGNLESDSRWYQSPSSTFMLFNKQRRIVYSLNVPHLEDLVNKPGAGLRVRVGNEKSGPWVSAGAAYKPMNKLLVKYDKKLASSEEGDDTGSAPLFPVVGYHSLFSADLGYRFSRSTVAISYLTDEPQAVDQSPDDPYIIEHPAAAKIYAFHADTQAEIPWFRYPVSLMVGYMRIDGGDIADYDAQGQYQGAVFAQRFQFTHAAMTQVEVRTDIKNKKLISRFKYLREFDQRGMIGSGEVTFFPVNVLGLTVGADVLGVDDTSPDNTDSRFLNEFRANDRVYAGLSYVF